MKSINRVLMSRPSVAGVALLVALATTASYADDAARTTPPPAASAAATIGGALPGGAIISARFAQLTPTTGGDPVTVPLVSDGSFHFDNLKPGTYRLAAMSTPKQTQNPTFGEKVQSGLAQTGGALASGAAATQQGGTEFGTKLWMGLGRWLPTPAGHAFARTVTAVLARRRDTSLYRTMRSNQAGVLGPNVSPEQLDAATRAVLGHAGMTAFDLMHTMAQGEDAVLRAVDFGADFWANVELLMASGRGVLICGCHLSNFNLAFLGFALKGFPVQVLSAAMPAAGFGLIAEMRNRGVLEETPISAAALRKAIARLRAGGAAAITEPPDKAEVAFTVEEDYHGLGIAGRMLRHLAGIAKEKGVAEFHAEVLPDNKGMLTVFSRSGFPVKQERREDVVHVMLVLKEAP